MQQISYTKIGTNRNSPRLWIEGVKLATAGFSRGDRYDLKLEEGILTIKKSLSGKRVISGRTRNNRDIPIIDLEMQYLLQGFEHDSRVRVVFELNIITITLHHEQLSIRQREAEFKAALQTKTLTEGSLFTGGGVSTMAIHQAIRDHGFSGNVKWVVDTELKYLQVGYANNFAITDQTSAIVGKAEEIETQYYSPVNILSFSMPCAGFSTAGKSKHKLKPETHDSATALFGVVNAIKAANPALLISENVTEAQNAQAYMLLKAELTRLGYAIFEQILDNRHTGTIENRKRYWFIGISNGLAKGFEYYLDSQAKEHDDIRINDILEQGIPETLWSKNQYLREKALRDKQDGKGFANRQLLTGSERHCGTIGRHYNKRRSTEPFIIREDGKERLFTPIEHARIKGIPESLVKDVSATTAHEVLGQSIDFMQGYLSMKCLMDFFNGKSAKKPPNKPPVINSEETENKPAKQDAQLMLL